jgi:MFS family permease
LVCLLLLLLFDKSMNLVTIASMAFSQMAMVVVMVISPLYMKDYEHSLSSISLALASHTFGMFGLSWVAGRLTDRWGRRRVILAGAGLEVRARAVVPLSLDILPLSAALSMSGLGWSFCFVAGSTVLSDRLSPPEQAMIQGTKDLLIGLVTAVASLSGGLLFALLGYSSICIAGVVLSLLPLGLAAWSRGSK